MFAQNIQYNNFRQSYNKLDGQKKTVTFDFFPAGNNYNAKKVFSFKYVTGL